jgi:hypothetical protein
MTAAAFWIAITRINRTTGPSITRINRTTRIAITRINRTTRPTRQWSATPETRRATRKPLVGIAGRHGHTVAGINRRTTTTPEAGRPTGQRSTTPETWRKSLIRIKRWWRDRMFGSTR